METRAITEGVEHEELPYQSRSASRSSLYEYGGAAKGIWRSRWRPGRCRNNAGISSVALTCGLLLQTLRREEEITTCGQIRKLE